MTDHLMTSFHWIRLNAFGINRGYFIVILCAYVYVYFLITKMNNKEVLKSAIIIMGEVLFFSEDTVHEIDHFRKSQFLNFIRFFEKIKYMVPKLFKGELWLVGYDNFQFFKL